MPFIARCRALTAPSEHRRTGGNARRNAVVTEKRCSRTFTPVQKKELAADTCTKLLFHADRMYPHAPLTHLRVVQQGAAVPVTGEYREGKRRLSDGKVKKNPWE